MTRDTRAVVAMWRDHDMYLCESNAVSPYWPVNGVQCAQYDDWIHWAVLADYNVVWAPIDEQISQGNNDYIFMIRKLLC